MAAFLTGRQARKTDGADIRVGVSVDQVAAQKVGQATRFASLEIGCEGGRNAGNCDSGYSCAYSSNLSWRAEATPMPRRSIRDWSSTGCSRRRRQGRRRRRPAASATSKSILDFVAEDANDRCKRRWASPTSASWTST